MAYTQCSARTLRKALLTFVSTKHFERVILGDVRTGQGQYLDVHIFRINAYEDAEQILDYLGSSHAQAEESVQIVLCLYYLEVGMLRESSGVLFLQYANGREKKI